MTQYLRPQSTRRRARRRIAPKAILRFKERIRELTCRHEGSAWSSEYKNSLPTCVAGKATSAYVRHSRYWKILISGSGAGCGLRSGSSGSAGTGGLRISVNGTSGMTLPLKTPGSSHGPWRLAHSRALAIALPNSYFESLGLLRLAGVH